jgi:hypothetical protein
MIGDRAGRPLLIRAPCSHSEQTSTRGSDAVMMPACPQLGQTIRVSMAAALARTRRNDQMVITPAMTSRALIHSF